jgi:hypothetical protein
MYLWLNNTIYEGPALAVMTTRSSAAPGLDLEPKSMKETNHHQLCAGWLMLSACSFGWWLMAGADLF